MLSPSCKKDFGRVKMALNEFLSCQNCHLKKIKYNIRHKLLSCTEHLIQAFCSGFIFEISHTRPDHANNEIPAT